MPIGVRGELYLGGLSIAHGYLHKPQLTKERFLPDHLYAGSFGDRPEPTMYKTGDIVAWRDDGQLDFFGRSDHQLKIRGFRVEIAEIENAIRLHPFVRDCVVVAEKNAESTAKLIAYVVTGGPDVVNRLTLRDFLHKSLPEHMIPQGVVCLDEFPLTTSGKIDRKALPKFNEESDSGRGYIAPEKDIEKGVAECFQEVLRVEKVGLYDDFFAIGGNSLLALRLVSRIRKTFAVELPMIELFQRSTVFAIAEYVSGLSSNSASDEIEEQVLSLATFQLATMQEHAQTLTQAPNLVDLRKSESGTPIFCVHGLGGHIVNFVPLARELSLSRPIIGIQGTGLMVERYHTKTCVRWL